MAMREKLMELCEDVILSCKSSLCADCEHNGIDYPNCMGVHFADHLIANGVTIQKYSRWVHRKNWDFFVCSECSHQFSDTSNYCPNCGAKMDGDGNG